MIPLWAFDVDGTIIGSIRNDRLRSGTAELLSALAERRVKVVLWSAGGAEYAALMADRHGIAHFFDAFYDKKDRGADGRYLTDHFHPEHRPTLFVDDSPDEMPSDSTVIGVAQFFGGNSADRALWSLFEKLDMLLGTPVTDDHQAASTGQPAPSARRQKAVTSA